jgi:hypothetical protein
MRLSVGLIETVASDIICIDLYTINIIKNVIIVQECRFDREVDPAGPPPSVLRPELPMQAALQNIGEVRTTTERYPAAHEASRGFRCMFAVADRPERNRLSRW